MEGIYFMTILETYKFILDVLSSKNEGVVHFKNNDFKGKYFDPTLDPSDKTVKCYWNDSHYCLEVQSYVNTYSFNNPREAARLIAVYLKRSPIRQNEVYKIFINQKYRNATVLSILKTRCRVLYDLPNKDDIEGWKNIIHIIGKPYLIDIQGL